MKQFMQKYILAFSLLAFISSSVSGCAYAVLAGVAAAGGYAVSQDTIQGDTDKDFNEVWDASLDIISIMGTISSQSRELGRIVAIANGARVTINVMQLTTATVRLKVKARKSLFPSIANAQNIYVKIMNRVNK